MQRIVLTGNPGCGKSAALQVFARHNYPVISADEIVQRLYEQGEAVAYAARRWGDTVLDARGRINKEALFRLMQEHKDIRQEVESIVHALVKAEIAHFWEQSEQLGAEFAAAEIPLYFECGWHAHTFFPQPCAVAIHCPQELRFARLAEHRGWTQDKIDSIEAWQWNETRKEHACDYVVDNSKTPAHLEAEIEALLAQLKSVQEQKQQAQLAAIFPSDTQSQ